MRWSEILGESRAVSWKAPNYSDHEVVWVDPRAIDASWSKDRDHYVGGPTHKNAIGRRYAAFGEWLQNAQEAVEMSVLSLDWRNEIYFSNGRHRFAWMRDHGARALPVMVPSDQAAEIQDRFGSSGQSTMISEAFGRGEPVSWNHKSAGMWNGSFVVGGRKFLLDIIAEASGEEVDEDDPRFVMWNVEFEATSGSTKYRNSGEMGGQATRVFASVVQGIREFIGDVDPYYLKFCGSKDQGRDGLYEKILSNLRRELASLGYSWEVKNIGQSVMFIVQKSHGGV